MNTVLVVDDEKDIRDMLSVALSAEGSAVQTTDSLLGALNILNLNVAIELMILDYNLPGMPMPEFLTEVRAIAPKIGIILISAADHVADKAQKYGIKYYLGKPIDFDELRKRMSACLADSVKN